MHTSIHPYVRPYFHPSRALQWLAGWKGGHANRQTDGQKDRGMHRFSFILQDIVPFEAAAQKGGCNAIAARNILKLSASSESFPECDAKFVKENLVFSNILQLVSFHHKQIL